MNRKKIINFEKNKIPCTYHNVKNHKQFYTKLNAKDGNFFNANLADNGWQEKSKVKKYEAQTIRFTIQFCPKKH